MKKLLFLFTSFFLLSSIFAHTSFAYQTGQAANVVVGQVDMSSANFGTDQYTFNDPEGVVVINNHLVVSDGWNHRVLIWNSIPTKNHVPADVVIGQPDFTSSGNYQNGTPASNNMGYAAPIGTDGTKLFICAGNRVLIYNHLPTTNDASADVVIGQPDMSSDNPGLSATTLNQPWGVAYDSTTGKLAITDSGNNRVLIYNSIPTANNQAADVVVGQPNMVTNSGGTSATQLNTPTHAHFYNGKLVASDQNNNRVLIWNTIPTTNSSPADVVIGQPDMTSNLANQGRAVGANTLDYAAATYYDGTYFYIADELNNRVLLYNGIPTTNNESAVKALGQIDLIHNSLNQGGTTSSNTLANPGDGGIASINNLLIFDDQNNNRVLIFQNDEYVFPTPGPASNPPDPNMLSGFKYQTMVGPNHTGPIQVVNGSTGAQDEKVILSSGISKDDIFISITKSTVSDLTLSKIPFPWQQGLNTVGDIYNFSSVSSFNGYLDNIFLKPVTVVLSYDPTKLNGHKPNQLRVAYYDLSKKKWIVLRNNTVVNYWNHTLANTTTVLSYMAVVYLR